MKRFSAARCSRGLIFLSLFAFATLASTRARAADAPESVAAQIERGRVLLGLGDARAVAVLQNAAQVSLDVLRRVSADENTDDFSPPREAAARVKWRRALLDALEAHRWLADSQIAASDNDAAIETLAPELQLANLQNEGAPNANANRDNTALLQARAKLFSLLPDGAPPTVSSATLQRLARFFYEVAPPQTEDFALPLPAQNVSQRVAFFDAPLAPRGVNEAASTRTPPLYRAYTNASLPPALQMDRAVFAYRAEDETHWKMIARVFYASPERTQKARDDAPRARFLASRFMKIAALQRALWKVENPQITNIWLLEKGADWPQKNETAHEDDAQNFRAGGWIESAPSDIFLFRADVPRSDFGWTRQLMHEYSHAVWPRFGGFAPPLEPFAAGLLGETLVALQLAQPKIARAFCDAKTSDFPRAVKLFSAAETRDLSADETAPISKNAADFLTAARAHLEANALPSLRLWNARGPRFPANQTGAESLRWTQGLAVFIERASGDETLSRVLREASRREYSQEKSAAPALLLSCYQSVLRAQWKEKSQIAFRFSRDEFNDVLNGEMLQTKNGARFSRWIYLPPNATSLEVSWHAGTPEKVPQLRVWLDGSEMKTKNVVKNGADFVSRLALEKRGGGWRKLEMSSGSAQVFSVMVR